MKYRLLYSSLIVLVLSCSPNASPDKKDFKVLMEAFHAGHLSIVSSILKETKLTREFSQEEVELYVKTLFYLGEWKEFFSFWSNLEKKSPQMVLLYFKAVLVSKERVQISKEDETKLLELVPISPEACLLYLKIHKGKFPRKHKKLFLAQGKQFQTFIARINQELGEGK